MKKNFYLAFFIIILSLEYSCISKKKSQAFVDSINVRHQSALDSINTIYNQEQETNRNLQLALSEERGVNRALADMQRVYMKELDSLQNEIVKLGSSAKSTRQNLNQDLEKRDRLIAEKEGKIQAIKDVIEKGANDLDSLAIEMATALSEYEISEVEVDKIDGKVRIQLFEKLMFRTNSLRVRTKGGEVLSKIAPILNKNPALFFEVRGNTDNKSVRNFKDNWDFAAQRAAAVVKVLTEEFEVSPNQIIVSSKGEFAPKTSNSTDDGRAANRRIEIFIEKRAKDILRDIQRTLDAGE